MKGKGTVPKLIELTVDGSCLIGTSGTLPSNSAGDLLKGMVSSRDRFKGCW